MFIYCLLNPSSQLSLGLFWFPDFFLVMEHFTCQVIYFDYRLFWFGSHNYYYTSYFDLEFHVLCWILLDFFILHSFWKASKLLMDELNPFETILSFVTVSLMSFCPGSTLSLLLKNGPSRVPTQCADSHQAFFYSGWLEFMSPSWGNLRESFGLQTPTHV